MRTRFVLLSPLIALVPITTVLAQSPSVGTLSVVRQVRVTGATGSGVSVGSTILTLKRSFAEVALSKGGIVRLGESTQALMTGAQSVALRKGRLWAQGELQVETPAGKVVGSGGSFEVVVVSSGEVRLYCYAGTLQLQRETGQERVAAGEGLRITLAGSLVEIEGGLSTAQQVPWWEILEQERGLLVTPGSSAGLALRRSALTETIQALHNLTPDPASLRKSPAEQQQLLTVARERLVPAIEQTLAANAGMTLAAYRNQYGGQDIARQFTLTGSDQQFLRTNGIHTVGDLFEALSTTGASIGVDVRSAHPTRAAYIPTAWQGARNRPLRRIDGTDNSGALLALGAAVALLGKRGNVTTEPLQGELFGVSAAATAWGGRLQAQGSSGQTRFQLEGNILNVLSGRNTGNEAALSVASVERELGGGVRAFVGRQRFYAGPVLQGLSQSQLIGERYSAVGVRAQQAGLMWQGAYLYDANPDLKGAQSGFLATATTRAGGGTFGVQAIQVGKLAGGSGYTVSGAFPASPGTLDLYAEVGVAPDKATIATVGAYFPALFQRFDTDVFIEYSRHTGLGDSVILRAGRTETGRIGWHGFLGVGQRAFQKQDTFAGLGVSVRFGR